MLMLLHLLRSLTQWKTHSTRQKTKEKKKLEVKRLRSTA